MADRPWLFPVPVIAALVVAALAACRGEDEEARHEPARQEADVCFEVGEDTSTRDRAPERCEGVQPSATPRAPDAWSSPDAGEIDQGFESDDPSPPYLASGSGSSSGGSGADGSSVGPASASRGDDAARVVEEADIVKIEGQRLYALSRFGGLSIVDIGAGERLTLLGRARTAGEPFEMYVRDGRVHVMLLDRGRWVDDGAGREKWVQSSELLTFDVTDARAIAEVARHEVPGRISDSRIVGDVLYLVTYENGYCWRCRPTAATIVTSFDVRSLAKIDQLSFGSTDGHYPWWRRSVVATSERLYIGGPSWSWTPDGANGSSVIEVVDISDPSGRMKPGARIPVAGQINSRWQMDEHAGVLRVVSQHGNGWRAAGGAVDPSVETFSIESASSFVPLGRTSLRLPRPESLRSVRFDGPRAYAITAEATDPLFTIDLSDPARPTQTGELEMPGWVFHMEPRGDRLVGFGFDDTRMGNARIAVSLFDVGDLRRPRMLERVRFGARGSTFVEDQDRIHKSVRLLDDRGLALVPFASRAVRSSAQCRGARSGVQLIDIARDGLTLRGLAPYDGARRAILLGDRLLAMSDHGVAEFDVTVHDAPLRKTELDLSTSAHRTVETPRLLASLTIDPRTHDLMLAVTSKESAEIANASGKLSLASLIPPSHATDIRGWGLFSDGDLVYVAAPAHASACEQLQRTVTVAVVDASDPVAPRLVGQRTIPLAARTGLGWAYATCGFHCADGAYRAPRSAVVVAGDGIVQVGRRIAFLDTEPERIEASSPSVRHRRSLVVVDFAQPTTPEVHALDLGDSLGVAPLHVLGGQVMTARWVPSKAVPGKVKFFVDRVDLAGDVPRPLASVNTPGSLVHVGEGDGVEARFVTADYRSRRVVAGSQKACTEALGRRAWLRSVNECVVVDRDLELSDFAAGKISLRSTLVPPTQDIAAVRVADDRVYVTRRPVYGDHQGRTELVEPGMLWALGGMRSGRLHVASERTLATDEELVEVRGTTIALTVRGSVSIDDTATSPPTRLATARPLNNERPVHVLLGDGGAVLSLGAWGLQTLRYD